MVSSLISISSYQPPRPLRPGGVTSTREIGRSSSSPTSAVKSRPRLSTTRWSPWTLTIPPSSTPCSWLFVTDSSALASACSVRSASALAVASGAAARRDRRSRARCRAIILAIVSSTKPLKSSSDAKAVRLPERATTLSETSPSVSSPPVPPPPTSTTSGDWPLVHCTMKSAAVATATPKPMRVFLFMPRRTGRGCASFGPPSIFFFRGRGPTALP